jgi:hypothetical protein
MSIGCYEKRPDYRDAVDALAGELPTFEPELVERVKTIFANHPFKLLRVAFQGRATDSAKQVTLRTEPSDLFLRLRAALHANDSDAIGFIEHELASPETANAGE